MRDVWCWDKDLQSKDCANIFPARPGAPKILGRCVLVGKSERKDIGKDEWPHFYEQEQTGENKKLLSTVAKHI